MSFSDPFYAPEYFTYFWEIAALDSDDPELRQQGVRELTAKTESGDSDAMLVLARYFLYGKHRDVYTALKWYLKAAQQGRWEGQQALARFYKHPEDEEMEQCVQRLRDEGCTDKVVFVKLRYLDRGGND